MNILAKFDYKTFTEGLLFYLKPLANMEFSYTNPLAWAFLFLLALILLRFWSPKKTLQFVFFLALILFLSNELAAHLKATNAGASPDQLFDADIVKSLSVFLSALLFLLYFFLMK